MEDQETLYVEFLEVGKGSYPEYSYISSGGLGPCIAVGVINTKTKVGYMLHHPDVLYYKKLLLDFLSQFDESDDFKVFAGGACPDGENGINDRKLFLKEQLGKKFKKVRYKWLKSRQCGGLVINLKRLTINFEIDDLDYH